MVEAAGKGGDPKVGRRRRRFLLSPTLSRGNGNRWDSALGRGRQRGSRANAGCGRQARVIGATDQKGCPENRSRGNCSLHDMTMIDSTRAGVSRRLE